MKVDRKSKAEEKPLRTKTTKGTRRPTSKTKGKHPLEAYEYIPVGIVESSLDGHYLDVNEEFCRIVGYPRHELLELGIKDCTHEDDYGIDAKLHEELVAGKIPFYKLEKRYIKKTGETIWVELTRTLVCDSKAKPQYTVGVVLDISERKDVERVLRDSVERLRLATQSARMFMWEWDLQQNIYTVDDNFEKVIGFSGGLLPRDRVVSVQRLMPPEDSQSINDALARAIERHTDLQSLEIRFINPENGDVVWLEINGKIVYDDEGTAVRMFGVTQNITERKRVQDEIAVISKMPSENPNPVMRLTPEGRILYANPASIPLVESWTKQSDQTIPAELQKLVTESFASRLKKEVEIDDNGKIFSFTLAPIHEGGYVNLYGKDITARKQAERALRSSEERMRLAIEANRMVTWEWDPVNDQVVTSENVMEVYGLNAVDDSATGFSLIWVDDLPAHREKVEQVTRQGGEYHSEFRVTRPVDGRVLWMEERATALTDAGGQVTRLVGVVTDITERKLAEQKLRESEERFRAIVSQATAGIAESDINSQLKFVNPRFTAMLGYTEAELIGKTVWELTHTEDVDENRRLFQRMLEQGQSYQFEKRFLRKDGSKLWTNVTVSTIRDLDGKPKGGVGVIIDIEQRKQAEAALTEFARQQEALYKLSDQLHRTNTLENVFDAALDAILSALQCDRASILLYDRSEVMRFVAWRGLSDAYRTATDGHSPWTPDAKDPRPITMQDVRTADLSEALRETILQEGIASLAFIPLVSNGKLIGKFMVYYNTPHAFDEGEVDLGVTIAHQLAFGIERKRTEQALRLENERFMQFVNSNIVGILIGNAKGDVILANDYYLRLLGVSREELLRGEVDWKQFTPPEWLAADEKAIQELRQRGICEPYEKEYVRIDGSRVPVYIANAMLPGPGDEIAAFVLDITERKRAEEALRASEERYRAVVESQSEMLCRFRPDGTMLFVNEAYARARGTTADDLMHGNFWDFVTEEDRPGVRAMLDGLTREKPEVQIENRFQTVEGERWTLWTNRALRFDEKGRLLEAQSSGIDITDRKRAEENLQLSEHKFSRIFHAAPFAIALQKIPDSRFADVNDAFVQLFGYGREELIGKTSEEVGIEMNQALRDRAVQQFERAGFMRNADLEIKTKAGEFIWVSVSAELVTIAGQDYLLALAVDSNARKRAEQDLRASEERYRFIVENTSDGIWWIELTEPMPVTLPEDEQVDWYYSHAVIRQCNLGLARMYGYNSVEEVLGLPLQVLMPRENTRNVDMLRQFIRSGYRLVDTETHELGRDGRELVFLNNMIGIVEDGILKGEWGTNRDITERKRAEEALRESEERYRGIVNQTIAGIAETDLTGKFIMVNDRYCQITGYSRRELIGEMRMQDITHPDDMPANLDQFARLAAAGTSFEIEKRYVRSDGSFVWVHNSVSAIVGADGKPHSAVAAVMDITERRRAEETLRRNEELFSTLVESAPFGVYFIDSEFRLRAINKGSEAVFRGIEPLIGRDFADILRIVWQEPFASEAIERFRHTLRTGEPFISPPTIEPRANINEIQSYDWQIHRITMPDGSYGVVCYFYDLSEQKRMEARVRASESLYRAIARNIPDGGVYVVDKDFRYLIAEGPVTEAFGLTREMLEGFTVTEAFPDERGARMEERLRRTFAGETVSFETKFGGRVYWTRQAPLHETLGQAIILTLDITERKQAEEALRQSEERFARFMQHLPGLAWIKDMEGRYVYANAAVEGVFGTPLEELYGSMDEDIFPPSVAAQFRQNDEMALRDEKGIQVIETLEQDDGILHYSLVSKFPIPGPDGSTALIGGTAFDITERRQAEEALRESETRFRALLRQATAGIVRKDAEGRLIFVNQAFCNMLGRTEEELLGKTMWDFMHEDDIAENKRSYQRLMLEGIPFKLERRMLREDGSIIWVDASVSPILDAEGRPQAAVAVEVDITGRKQAEEALRELNLQLEDRVLSRTAKLRAANQALREEITERRKVEEALRRSEAMARGNEEKLSTLFDLLPVGISFLDPNGQIIQMNSALVNILKLSKEQLASQGYQSRQYIRPNGTLMQPSDFASQRALTQGKTVYNVETGVVLENNEVIWTSVSAAPVAVADVGAVVVTMDVTEAKLAERALQESRERLQILSQRLVEVQEEERRAIARELHDRVGQTLAALNINLIIISGQLTGKVDEQINVRLSDSMKLVAETIALVRDVMSNLRPSVLDDYGLEAAIESYLSQYTSRYEIQAKFDKPDRSLPRLGPSIEMTFLRIAQEALMNIARHAQASQVHLSLWQADNAVGMTVEDNGMGIRSWQEANRPGSHGLTIMRERAEAFGGSLKVNSTPGKGTKVEVKIPVETNDSSEIQKETKE